MTFTFWDVVHLKIEFDFFSVNEIMNTSGLMQSTCSWSYEQTKTELITYIYKLYCLSSINFQFSYNFPGFRDILNYTRHNGALGTAKTPNSRFNVMPIHARRQTNVSKQTTFLDGIDVGPPKQRVCWRGLNRSVQSPDRQHDLQNQSFWLPKFWYQFWHSKTLFMAIENENLWKMLRSRLPPIWCG